MASKGSIDYSNKPHFTIGKKNQWFERGYFYHEGEFYFYEDDRHENFYHYNFFAGSEEDFLDKLSDEDLDEMPEDFMDNLT